MTVSAEEIQNPRSPAHFPAEIEVIIQLWPGIASMDRGRGAELPVIRTDDRSGGQWWIRIAGDVVRFTGDIRRHLRCPGGERPGAAAGRELADLVGAEIYPPRSGHQPVFVDHAEGGVTSTQLHWLRIIDWSR